MKGIERTAIVSALLSNVVSRVFKKATKINEKKRNIAIFRSRLVKIFVLLLHNLG